MLNCRYYFSIRVCLCYYNDTLIFNFFFLYFFFVQSAVIKRIKAYCESQKIVFLLFKLSIFVSELKDNVREILSIIFLLYYYKHYIFQNKL